MEELIGLLLQLLLEIALEVLLQLGYTDTANRVANHWANKPFRYTLAVVTGCGLGWLSLSFWPHSLLPSNHWQVANLVLAPYLSAELSGYLARARQKNNPAIDPGLQFWQAGLFTGTLVLTRYLGITG